jgi:uncharacterized membrane protein (UPF0127 family)
MKFESNTRVFALISLLISIQFSGGMSHASVSSFEQGYVQIKEKLIRVEFAKTNDEKTIGLSNRDLNANNSFMLFIYNQPQRMSFWMKDTRKDLSIAFIDANNKIVQIENLKAKSLKILDSKSTQIKYVLEVPKGYFGLNKIKVGDKVAILK